jgi:hypothetical protein
VGKNKEVTVHDLFGKLHGWLEEQPVRSPVPIRFNVKEQGEDVYVWKIRDKRLDKRKVITEFDKLDLKSKDQRYEAPSSRLLRIHARQNTTPLYVLFSSELILA